MSQSESTPRRSRKTTAIVIAVTAVATLVAIGWMLAAEATARAAAQDEATAAFDAEIAACVEAAAEHKAEIEEKHATATADLAAAIAAAEPRLNDAPAVADETVIAVLEEHLEGGRELLATEPIYTTITCTARPDPLLADTAPVVTEVINQVYPGIGVLQTQILRIEAALDAIEESQLDYAREQLSDAIRAAQDVLDASDGEVDDDTIRTALQAAITDADAVVDDEDATVDQLDAATESLTGPQAAVEDAHTAWLAAKAAADAASATAGTASSGGSSSGSGGSTSGGGSSSGGSSGTSGGSSSGSSGSGSGGSTSGGSTGSGSGSGGSSSGGSGGGSSTPAPAPSPTPTPPPPAAVNEWGGLSIHENECVLTGTGWATSLASARSTGAANGDAWHLTGTTESVNIAFYGCW